MRVCVCLCACVRARVHDFIALHMSSNDLYTEPLKSSLLLSHIKFSLIRIIYSTPRLILKYVEAQMSLGMFSTLLLYLSEKFSKFIFYNLISSFYNK